MQKENNNGPEYIIRRSNANDYKAINYAYNRFTSRSRTMEQYLWQWVHTPFEPSESWVIDHVPSNKVVGHHGVMYLSFMEEGRRIPVGKTENTFVLNDHAKKIYYPGFEKTAFKNMRDRFAYIYTTAADSNRGAVGLLRKRLGYISIGKLVTYGLHYSRATIKKRVQKKYPWIKLSAGFLAVLHSLVQWSVRCVNNVKTRKITVIPMQWKSIAEVETFWRRHSSYYGITADRNAAYLRWRYSENPYLKFDIVKLVKEDEVFGYAVLKKTRVNIMGANFSAIVIDDLIVAEASETNFYFAIAAITRYCSDEDLTLFLTLNQTDSINKSIRSFLGPLSRWHAMEGSEVLTWKKTNKNTSWYFTNILTEGVANDG